MSPNQTDNIWLRIPRLKDELLECIERKWSAQQTAEHLSRMSFKSISRNACIGKATRLGLRFHSPNAGQYHREPPKPVWSPMPKLSTENLQTTEFLGLNITELKDNSCRYIEGEVPDNYSYCGQPTAHGSWCEHHLKIVTGGYNVHGSERRPLQNGSGRAYRSHPSFKV